MTKGLRRIGLDRQTNQPLARHLGQDRVSLFQLAANRRGADLHDDRAAIRHLNHLPVSRQADVLTQMILELSNPDLSHAFNVATRGYVVKPSWDTSIPTSRQAEHGDAEYYDTGVQ